MQYWRSQYKSVPVRSWRQHGRSVTKCWRWEELHQKSILSATKYWRKWQQWSMKKASPSNMCHRITINAMQQSVPYAHSKTTLLLAFLPWIQNTCHKNGTASYHRRSSHSISFAQSSQSQTFGSSISFRQLRHQFYSTGTTRHVYCGAQKAPATRHIGPASRWRVVCGPSTGSLSLHHLLRAINGKSTCGRYSQVVLPHYPHSQYQHWWLFAPGSGWRYRPTQQKIVTHGYNGLITDKRSWS